MKFLQEGTLANFLNRLTDLILLNLLWFVCCLPIFTIGASTCALYEITMRYALYEEPPIIRTFFETFRHSFKKATLLFLAFLAAGLFLALDLWCAILWDIPFRFVFIVVILAVFYFYLAVLSHVFPVLAYFDAGVKESVRRAFLFSMKNGVFTVFIMVINLLPALAIVAAPAYFGEILFLYLILGFSVISLLSSLHLVRLFDPQRAANAQQTEVRQRQLKEEDGAGKEDKEA